MSDLFSQQRATLEFEGATHFRMRLVCAILSQRTVRITRIRVDAQPPGLRDYEASMLRLVEKISTGARIRIAQKGTEVEFVPGFVAGGVGLTHDCPVSRGIGESARQSGWRIALCQWHTVVFVCVIRSDYVLFVTFI